MTGKDTTVCGTACGHDPTRFCGGPEHGGVVHVDQYGDAFRAEPLGPVETLRAAAEVLRSDGHLGSLGSATEAAIPVGVNAHNDPVNPRPGEALAEPLANMLDEAANSLERHIPAWMCPSEDDPPALAKADQERLAETIEHHFGVRLAVARVILGEGEASHG